MLNQSEKRSAFSSKNTIPGELKRRFTLIDHRTTNCIEIRLTNVRPPPLLLSTNPLTIETFPFKMLILLTVESIISVCILEICWPPPPHSLHPAHPPSCSHAHAHTQPCTKRNTHAHTHTRAFIYSTPNIQTPSITRVHDFFLVRLFARCPLTCIQFSDLHLVECPKLIQLAASLQINSFVRPFHPFLVPSSNHSQSDGLPFYSHSLLREHTVALVYNIYCLSPSRSARTSHPPTSLHLAILVCVSLILRSLSFSFAHSLQSPF